MLGRVMKLQFAKNAPRLFRLEALVERSRLVRLQVVHDHTNTLGLRVLFIYQPVHLRGEVLQGVPLSHSHVPPTRFSLAEGEELHYTVAAILIIKAFGPSRLSSNDRAFLRDQLLA